ncbi:hypothetical protein [Oceanobacillus jeddahense]|uniref:hypothetical protein n=1 Tax=Oceanobacillus jeddahense TaxID=1462527 RepID=UPI001B7D7960|nr:hypothetical protein [Oceanobacillus jeddahense]
MVLEEKADYMKHDRLTKKLIKAFFEEFVEEFPPDLHSYIDFSNVTFLEQEVYLDYLKGSKKEIDVLAEVKLHHQDKILHIHIEPQSTHEAEFPERMFLYFSLSSSKRQKLGANTSRTYAQRVKVNIGSLPHCVSFISVAPLQSLRF